MSETVTVIVEREFAHPPEKLWRALTQPHLIADWLMQNDFALALGHRFTLRTAPRGNWNGVIECEVLSIDPGRSLSYTWGSGADALNVGTVVTFTLTPTRAGTHLRMEQSGFRQDQPQNYNGAKFGWQAFLGKLDETLARAN